MSVARRFGLPLLISCAVAISLLANAAEARWAIHNGNDGSDMTAPPGGTLKQTCSDQLRGLTGWSNFVADGEELDPIPGDAFTGTNYEVWKAPPGFTNFGQAQAVFDDEGNPIGYTFNGTPATSVVNFTTIPRTEVVTPQPLHIDSGSGDVYVFTAAQITQALPGVAPGDVLGLKPTGGASFVNLTAIDCDDTGDYLVSDFFGAVNAPPIVNTGDTGESYVVRFQLKNAANDVVSAKQAVGAVTQAPTDCSSLSNRPTDAIESSTTGTSRLRFVSAKNQFVYRWQAPTEPGCYKLKFIYDSGQHKQALFNLQ